MKYRKKPVIVDVEYFDGDLNKFLNTNCEWIKKAFLRKRMFVEHGNLVIRTLEGNMVVNPFDYIIKGVDGEIYPCKPSIFDKTYEEVTK